jgi:hypothetical protein
MVRHAQGIGPRQTETTMTRTEAPTAPEALLLEIARRHFPRIQTLETRNSDALDFHDVAVWSIRAALEAAYAAGRAAARR